MHGSTEPLAIQSARMVGFHNKFATEIDITGSTIVAIIMKFTKY